MATLKNWRFNDATPTSYVFLIAGQSNAVGRGETFDAGLDTTDPRIRQLKQTNQLAIATEPLDHVDPEAADVGFGLAFGRAFVAEYGADVILVPCAQGSSGFPLGNWNPGNGRYEQTIDRINFALKSQVNSKFAGILWHQGESSASASWTQSQHEVALDAMIVGMRSDIIAPEVPFILGGLSPDWYTGNSIREGIQAAIADTPNRIANSPNRIANCAYVSSAGLDGNVGDEIHIDAASQRIFGQRYFDAWKATL